MKRMTAWLAAFCLIATCILPVRAAETSGTDLFRTALEDTGTDSQKTEEENQSEVKAGTISGTAASTSPVVGASPMASANPEESPTVTPSINPEVSPSASAEVSPSADTKFTPSPTADIGVSSQDDAVFRWKG